MQTMLRLVGFGDNAGSGFPTILDVWKSEGWIKPELIEDTNLDQVTLVMKMEKESDDEISRKNSRISRKISGFKKNESNRFIRKAEADFSLYGCWGLNIVQSR